MHRPGKELPKTGAGLMDRLVISVLEESRRKRAEDDSGGQAPEPELASLLKPVFQGLDMLRSCLEAIAYKARERRQHTAGRFVDKDLLAAGLAFSDKVKVADLLEVLRHRAGLLQSQDGENFEFAYRFEEFLAGCYLAKRNAWVKDEDLCHFHRRALKLLDTQEDYARQVVLWAAGFNAHVQSGDENTVRELVWALTPPAATADERSLSRLDLAADIAHDAGMENWPEMLVPGAADTIRLLRARLEEVRDGEGHFDAKTRSRAASAIGRVGDPRPGVGLKDGLPDIEWVELPAGEFRLGETGAPQRVSAFKLSRYPITWAQYQAFVDDADGYQQERFWNWLTAALTWWKENKDQGPVNYEPVFQTPNHPRVGVCWYEAAAFCRWLSEKMKRQIRLPHKEEWEWAARCVQKRDDKTGKVSKVEAHNFKFPWQSDDEKDLAHRCNCDQTGIGHTSAVGLFPGGKADCGAMDLSGNV